MTQVTAGTTDAELRELWAKKKVKLDAAEKQWRDENPLTCEDCGKPMSVDDCAIYEEAYSCLRTSGTRPPGTVCKKCAAARGIERDRQEAERQQQQRREREESRKRRIQEVQQDLSGHIAKCGVPSVLREARLDQCPDLPRDLVECARAWTQNPEGFVVLTGKPGAGKSHLAAAILAQILYDGTYWPLNCAFVSQPAWLDDVRQEYGNIESDPRPVSIPLLVFDDLGAGYLNEIRRAVVEQLIRRRDARQLPTLVTTNLSIAEIQENFGGRVTSVLQQDNRVWNLTGSDLRISGKIKPQRPARIRGDDPLSF